TVNYRRAVVDDQVIVACPRIMKPVCGSDSFTYDNDCGICFCKIPVLRQVSLYV
uniref:Kazal-like domain-containing protein n=1 Tax=Cyanistes caeruleus TaxID=156563 RepID=A0A8C0Z8J2_CYACU